MVWSLQSEGGRLTLAALFVFRAIPSVTVIEAVAS